MNREILFKAKTTKKHNRKHVFNDVWVEGDLVRSGGKYYIHPIANKVKIDGELGKIIVMHEVDQNTICQYTGLTDKNGQKIWENDICIVKDGTLDEEDGCFICKWDNCTARYILDGSGLAVDFDNVDERDIEVIGNIFDNAELLEVE